VRVWLGPAQHFACYPVDGGRQISFAATVPAAGSSAESWSVEGSAAELSAAYQGWNPVVTGVVAAAGSVKRWALHDREPLRRWSAARLTLLGDAAHPMLPFMAQGANQAIEDAFALARCLADAAMPAALATYDAVRIPRTTAVQLAARGRAGRGPSAQPRHPANALDPVAWLYAYDAESAAARGAA
jgi:salicylate hydroxylase